MPYFFTFAMFIALILFITGLIDPGVALFWKKTPVTRKESVNFYAPLSFLLFVALSLTIPKTFREQVMSEEKAAATARQHERETENRTDSVNHQPDF